MKRMSVSGLVAAMSAAMLLPLSACGNAATEAPEQAEAVAEADVAQEAAEQAEAASEAGADVAQEAEQETPAGERESTLDYSEIARWSYEFSSGAGGWATELTIDSDGSFHGLYHDSEMGSTGEGYPNGTFYHCEFTGRFGPLERVGEYTLATTIEHIEFKEAPGMEEIADDMLYIASEAYGMDGAERILFYLPGKEVATLPEEFRQWCMYAIDEEDTTLQFVGLYNETPQYGFYSVKVSYTREELLDAYERVCEEDAAIEDRFENEDMNQLTMNFTASDQYVLWDSFLNDLWRYFKVTLSGEEMEALTVKQREWIAYKEQAAKDEAATYEGGSIYPLIYNRKLTELTKARVAELMNYLRN